MVISMSHEPQKIIDLSTGSNEQILEEIDRLNTLLAEHSLRLNDILIGINQASFLGRAFYLSSFIPITLCIVYTFAKHLLGGNKYVTDYSLPSPVILLLFAIITLLSMMIFYLLKVKAGEIVTRAMALSEHLKTLSARGIVLREFGVHRGFLDYTRLHELEFKRFRGGRRPTRFRGS